MESANAFDMLILPILQYFAGIVASFSILQGIGVGLGRLLEGPGRRQTRPISRNLAHDGDHQPVGPRRVERLELTGNLGSNSDDVVWHV